MPSLSTQNFSKCKGVEGKGKFFTRKLVPPIGLEPILEGVGKKLETYEDCHSSLCATMPMSSNIRPNKETALNL